MLVRTSVGAPLLGRRRNVRAFRAESLLSGGGGLGDVEGLRSAAAADDIIGKSVTRAYPSTREARTITIRRPVAVMLRWLRH